MKKAKTSISLYYLTISMTGALMFNFFPVYLSSALNLNAQQIGTIMSTGGLIALFTTSFWGYMQDKWKNAPKLLALLTIMYLIFNFSMINSKTFIVILVLKIISEFFRSGMYPTVDNYLFSAAHTYKFSASSIRVFGSLGYSMIILIVSFLIDDSQAKLALSITSVFLACSAIMTFLMPKIHHVDSIDSLGFVQSIKALIKNKSYMYPMLYFAVLMGTSEAFFTFNGQHITQTLQATTVAFGVSILFAAGIEIPVFFAINKIYKRFNVQHIFFFVALLNMVRWILMMQTTNIYIYILLMLVHGIGFALSFQAIILMVKKATPHHIHGSAIALLGTSTGLVNFIVTLMSGYIIVTFATTYSVFYLNFVLSLLVLFLAYKTYKIARK